MTAPGFSGKKHSKFTKTPIGRARHNPDLVVKFGGEICGGVLVENASDDFPQRKKKLENLLPNFAGSSPPISPKTSPTSLWKSLVLTSAFFWFGSERSKPSHSQSLANLVADYYSQGISAARTNLSQLHSQNHSHSQANFKGVQTMKCKL